ncbi:MAG: endonuclease V [candidate division Zixibacteria bacterium]|nr:endonuclease V [candidate division Zixibacteria bacterium]NIR66181.1 endonuclease V [candidate division Zixibacteria bacterium]NIS17261.1 endonuclease V [candidate division Zixibacteria bacterium]NIS47804.1 endonuclease V [candidate division Zixibacteria bacterium]NIT53618.1 endonuclease V [candidate division Zixibacteria bacterium]
MKFARMHQWTTDLKEAARIQEELVDLVEVRPPDREFETIAGADVAYSKRDEAIFASVVVMKFPELVPLEKVRAQSYVNFPYIPGFLYFREGPVLAKALERLETVPDVIMFDANGIAHPKRIGMASHFGLMLDLPVIGCAKKKLIGNFRTLPDELGARAPLEAENEEMVGYAVRTRMGVKPLFVSAGHKIDNETAADVVSATTRGYRLPEPLRIAHIMVNKMRRNYDSRQKPRRDQQSRDRR